MENDRQRGDNLCYVFWLWLSSYYDIEPGCLVLWECHKALLRVCVCVYTCVKGIDKKEKKKGREICLPLIYRVFLFLPFFRKRRRFFFQWPPYVDRLRTLCGFQKDYCVRCIALVRFDLSCLLFVIMYADKDNNEGWLSFFFCPFLLVRFSLGGFHSSCKCLVWLCVWGSCLGSLSLQRWFRLYSTHWIAFFVWFGWLTTGTIETVNCHTCIYDTKEHVTGITIIWNYKPHCGIFRCQDLIRLSLSPQLPRSESDRQDSSVPP